MKEQKKVGQIYKMERLANSKYGDPRYNVYFYLHDGAMYLVGKTQKKGI